jgi:hypothetical protein
MDWINVAQDRDQLGLLCLHISHEEAFTFPAIAASRSGSYKSKKQKVKKVKLSP